MTLREAWLQFRVSFGGLGPKLTTVLGWKRASDNPADDPARVHVFAGAFTDEAEMFAYCFTPVTANGPEPLNLDLPDAPINTGFVEAAYGDQILSRLSEYFDRPQRQRFMARLKDGEAVVLIPNAAFEGLSYKLHSTQRLRYLGYKDSLAPSVRAMLG